MSFIYTKLNIKRIVLHQIFKRDKDKQVKPLKYSTSLTTLNEEGMRELQNRIVTALGNDSHSIEMNIANVDENSTFQILTKIMEYSDEEFVKKSREIAYKLAEAQNRTNIPGGIVVIFDGEVGIDKKKFISVIKAEIHGGFTLNDNKERGILLKFIANLVLTPQQKLYKIGMFTEMQNTGKRDNLRSPDDFKAFIYDQNMNSAETSNAAVYFYSSFLGCSVTPTSKKLTRDFYNYTKEFVNTVDISAERKFDLNQALYTYLNTSNHTIVSVSQFKDEYLDIEEQDMYCDYMENNKFPMHAVSKDLSYIKSKLKKRKVNFSSKVQISAPSEKFSKLVEIKGHEGNKTILHIEGHIQGDE
ncbi:nucleoid-associated protein [Clostridium aestuarii]|uniref:Nucleoid-associated protein n=1 Tax=Clostridium aestuarii TaxID=338193 RepID=A0ABT4CY24_9CLOT|nr:nucleoid-associated protein [Clostridium aestuarii]MCY6483888.1 nucleoid-associated protein [Clostridium aestuarii]